MNDLLEYKGYHGTVNYSQDDRCLIGEVLFINGSIVYAGESVAEITSMFEQAVDGYLQMCQDKGLTPQKPFKGSFNVRIAAQLHQAAALAAARQGVSLNQWVAGAIRDALSDKPQARQAAAAKHRVHSPKHNTIHS